MKRILSVILVILMVVSFVSCTAEKKEPKYHYTMYDYLQIEDMEEVEKIAYEGGEPPEAYLKTAEDILDKLSNYYGIHKERPNYVYLTDEELAKNEIPYDNVYGGLMALYSNGIIYLHQTNTNPDSYIAHETVHFLADNGKYGGFHYEHCGVIFGKALEEGTCNYFSTKVYPHYEYYISVYPFETHVAKLLAISFGENNLRDAYFGADVSSLREDFNETVKDFFSNSHIEGTEIELTPFDDMTSSLGAYYFYTSVLNYGLMYKVISDEEMKECAARATLLSLSIEEMLIFYAREKGVEKEARKEMNQFMNEENGLTALWEYLNMGKLFSVIE